MHINHFKQWRLCNKPLVTLCCCQPAFAFNSRYCMHCPTLNIFSSQQFKIRDPGIFMFLFLTSSVGPVSATQGMRVSDTTRFHVPMYIHLLIHPTKKILHVPLRPPYLPHASLSTFSTLLHLFICYSLPISVQQFITKLGA